MKDYSVKIIKAIIARLDSLDIDIHSVVPNNPSYPFIYITDISAVEGKNKTNFLQYGYFTIVYENMNTGSMLSHLEVVSSIKEWMQRYKGDKILDEFIYMKLFNEGKNVINYKDKQIFRSALTYEFKLNEPMTYYDRVIIGNGTVESLNCTKG